MRNELKILSVIVLAVITLTVQAQPGQSGKGNGNSGRNDAASQGNISVEVGITVGQARNIAEELDLTGYSSLPPGIAKNVSRGKPLPPGIAKKFPPQNMLSRLPKIADHEWQVSGKDLILVAIGTAIIVEVLEAVFD